MGECGNGGVVFLQRIGRPADGPVSEDRPFPGQRVLFAEDLSGAVFVRAAPQLFCPEQPDGPARTRDVVEADPAPAVADSDNPAGRAASHGFVSFNMDDQASIGLGNGSDVNARNTKQGIGAIAPPPAGARSRVRHVRVSLGNGCLVATNSKRP